MEQSNGLRGWPADPDPHQRVVGSVTLMEYGIGNRRGLIGLDH